MTLGGNLLTRELEMYTQKDPGDQDEKRHIFSELVYDEFNLPCCWTVG